MLSKLTRTNSDAASTILRLVLGVVFITHGAQLMLGWWGGGGFSATMTGFEHAGVPAVFAFLAIAAEFFGAVGLILGLLGRVAAFGIACVMVVAIVKVHAVNGFFMNWAGQQKGEGFEFHLLVLAMTAAIMIAGMTDHRPCSKPIPQLIEGLHRHLKGWSNYFDFGYPSVDFGEINTYVRDRVTPYLRRRSQRPFRSPEGIS